MAEIRQEGVTLAHMSSHTSGVSGWEQPIRPREVIDVATATAKLATQSPWWEPGSASGYHAISQGHLDGEVVRRASGSTLGQYFAAEIADPLDTDFHIGLADEHHRRVSDVIYPATNDIEQRLAESNDTESIMHKTFGGPQIDPAIALTHEWGGSLVIVDTDRRMVVSYMMHKMRNGLLGDLRGVALAMVAFAAVEPGSGPLGQDLAFLRARQLWHGDRRDAQVTQPAPRWPGPRSWRTVGLP